MELYIKRGVHSRTLFVGDNNILVIKENTSS